MRTSLKYKRTRYENLLRQQNRVCVIETFSKRRMSYGERKLIVASGIVKGASPTNYRKAVRKKKNVRQMAIYISPLKIAVYKARS